MRSSGGGYNDDSVDSDSDSKSIPAKLSDAGHEIILLITDKNQNQTSDSKQSVCLTV